MSCAFWLNSCMIFEHSGQTVSIARLKAKPTALFATAFKQRDHLARVDEGEGPGEDIDAAATRGARGSCRLAMLVVFCGKRVQTLPRL